MNATLPADITLSDVISILDSKIQYIEHCRQCSMSQAINVPVPDEADKKDAAIQLTQNFDFMLRCIHRHKGELQRLQIMKCWLRFDNMSTVFDLLVNDIYRKVSEEKLESMLKKGAYELLCMQHGRV